MLPYAAPSMGSADAPVTWLAAGLHAHECSRLSLTEAKREEGDDIAAACTLTPYPIRADELPAGLQPTEAGHVRTDPGMLPDDGGLDGFFVARFKV